MENSSRQLERQGLFSPAAQNQEDSRAVSISPIPVDTPTLPVQPQVDASTPADVRAPESLSMQSLFHGELEAEALQNGFVLLAAIRRETRIVQRCFSGSCTVY